MVHSLTCYTQLWRHLGSWNKGGGTKNKLRGQAFPQISDVVARFIHIYIRNNTYHISFNFTDKYILRNLIITDSPNKTFSFLNSCFSVMVDRMGGRNVWILDVIYRNQVSRR